MGSVPNPAVNPFAPTFGAPPPLFAGRDDILRRFDSALDTGPTHPDYTMLITGERGTGKTALLNVLEARCAERGWQSITAAASTESLFTRITNEAQRLLAEMAAESRRPRLSSISALGVGIEMVDEGHRDSAPAGASLLTTLERLAEALQEISAGLLITVDELHDAERDDVRDVASAVQIVTRRQQRPLAFAAAALAFIENTHLADVNMTFLQRCARARLDALDSADARRAIRQPIQDSGSDIDCDALDEAVAATLGHPYMIQLVGFHAWEMRTNTAASVSVADVRAGIVEADHAMVGQIAGPIWNRLSAMDRRFLVAMLDDGDDSALSDIADRIGRDLQYTRVYRRRLLSAGAIDDRNGARVAYRHHALRKRAQNAVLEDPDLSPSNR